jgi:hypothetical protein
MFCQSNISENINHIQSLQKQTKIPEVQQFVEASYLTNVSTQQVSETTL